MRRNLIAWPVLLSLFAVPLNAGDGPKKDKIKHTNRLAKEISPYLLMHAHNPVDWYPWGEEAFAKAKKEGKLVFLSIGYSSCYWCHVMERESFQSEEVAKLLAEGFVCIKVDREERPDVDQIYMTALHTMREGGGWPLSMFLTADGKPIIGGTYWPREDKKENGEVYRGFKSIVKYIHDVYKKSPKEVHEQADQIAKATIDALTNPTRGVALVELNRTLVTDAVDQLRESFDSLHGGFGSPSRKFKGPKFPTPCRLELVLNHGVRTKSDELIKMVTLTLDQMAQGGIYDQLGGGFHRYSTERTWTVPHFEKMLYDNAQLVELYSQAYRVSKKPRYRRIVQETIAYLQREMMTPEGGFYSSQDAETHHEEGRSYVWTDKEIDAVLPDKADARLVRKVYGAEDKPNFENKYHIFTQRKPIADVAKELKLTEEQVTARLTVLRKKLLEARDRREQPFLNKIMLTSWSGEMIAGLATAGQALAEPKYVELAAKAADFLLKHQRTKDGRLLRTYGAQPGQPPKAQGNGYLEDYAFVVHGLLNLHDATKDKKWLDQARTLTDTMIKYHGEEKRGGYYFTANDHEKLFARAKDQFDGAQPSGNSVALRNLARLWAKTGEDRYRAEADKGFRTFAGSLKSFPGGLSAMVLALDQYLDVKEARSKKPE